VSERRRATELGGGHMVELALAEKQHVPASGEKGVDAAKQAGDVRRRFVGRGRSSREAEKASGPRLCFAQLIANLLNGGSQQSRVALRVSGIHVAKVAGRKHDGLLVESLCRGNGQGPCRGKIQLQRIPQTPGGPGGYGGPKSRMRPAKIDVVDFDALEGTIAGSNCSHLFPSYGSGEGGATGSMET
jgi:hypothetical protein